MLLLQRTAAFHVFVSVTSSLHSPISTYYRYTLIHHSDLFSFICFQSIVQCSSCSHNTVVDRCTMQIFQLTTVCFLQYHSIPSFLRSCLISVQRMKTSLYYCTYKVPNYKQITNTNVVLILYYIFATYYY